MEANRTASHDHSVVVANSFKSWVHCICTVTFDLELGQALEFIYPDEVELSEKECSGGAFDGLKANICYLSFPDSNSGFVGDTCFHFRLRRDAAACGVLLSDREYNAIAPAPLCVDSAHYFGFVYFRQMKDASIPRGYLQKSVVIITQLPLFNLFQNLIQFIAPGYFLSGKASIEAACHNIDQWPLPKPGVALTLPLMGSVIHCRLPTIVDKSSPGHRRPSRHKAFPEPLLLPTPHEVNLYECMYTMIPYLQLFWELVLLNEPIVVMGPTPRVSSQFVQCLVSLIWPLSYGCDYRPFFTIHDTEFREYTTRTQAPPGVLLGVTNPFFGKTLGHWPHVIRISEEGISPESVESSPINTATGKMKRGAESGRTLDGKPGIYSKYSCFLYKDKHFLKQIFKGVQSKRPAEVQSAMIRKNFVDLTLNFLIPLERHLASTMPLHRSIKAFRCTPKIRDFDAEEFLANLDDYGPQMTTGVKGDWQGLYRKFLDSKNFHVWLKSRRDEINRKLEMLHIEAICNENFEDAVKDKSEVELVDIMFRLQEKEAFLREPANISRLPEFDETLKKQRRIVFDSLSPDLRSMLECPT